MMKKEYIKPEMSVIECEYQNDVLLCYSNCGENIVKTRFVDDENDDE